MSAPAPALPTDLGEALARFAARARVLVALDFDGVLAPIVEEPESARALPASSEAVDALTRCPGVSVAVVSGRALADLRRVTGFVPPVLLVGSHGAESALDGEDGGDGPPLDEAAQRLLEEVDASLQQVAGEHPGARVEHKPTAAVLHVRQAAPDVAAAATAAALDGPARLPGVQVTEGKQVVEIAVVETGKGTALRRLRELLGVDAVLYAGDDVTDERAFAVLGDGDVAVKVGDGPTRAAHRLPDPAAVTALLTHLLALRAPSPGGAG